MNFLYFHVALATLFSTVLGIQKVTGRGHREVRRDVNQTNDTAVVKNGESQAPEHRGGIWEFFSSLFTPEGSGTLYNFRVCNAYTSRKALDMHRVRNNISKIFGTGGLRYKMCHDFPMATQANDTFIFEVGGKEIGNYTIPEIHGEPASVVMLVPHRHSVQLGKGRSHQDKSANIKFRVFGAKESIRELSLVNSVPQHLKKQTGDVMLLETPVSAKKVKARSPNGKAALLQSAAKQKRLGVTTHLVRRGFSQLRARRLRKRRYEVMASSTSNGNLSAVLDASKNTEATFSSAFQRKYVVMRVGSGEPGYPEELVVFPSKSSAFSGRLHITFAFIGLLVHFGLQ